MAQAIKQPLADRHGGKMQPATFEPQDRLLAEYTALRYDYSRVSEEHRRHVQDAAVDIRRRERRAAEDLLVIGQRLISIKQLLGHGQFEEWIDAEFIYSPTTAKELMQIARRFEGKTTIIVDLGATVMRLLAAPSVPDEVISAVVEATETEGRPLKVREVKAIREAHRPAPKMISLQATVTTPEPSKIDIINRDLDAYAAETRRAYAPVEPEPTPVVEAPPAKMTFMEPPVAREVEEPVEEPTADELAAVATVTAEQMGEDDLRAARDALRAPFERVPPAPIVEDAPTLPAELAAAGYRLEPWPALRQWRFVKDRVHGLWRRTAQDAIEDAQVHFDHWSPRRREGPEAAPVVDPATEPEPVHPFEAWVRAMPPITGLYECRLLVELGQLGAEQTRQQANSLQLRVEDAMRPLRILIKNLNGLLAEKKP